MNPVELIRQTLALMTRSEKAVANTYFDKTDAFLFGTLDEVAKLSEVSTTTVLRFCRRLGFDGFKDFQNELRSAGAIHPNLPEKFSRTVKEGRNSLLSRSVLQGILCIQESFQGLDEYVLEEAVKRILKARRVWVFGMKESFAIAHYAYTRLTAVRSDVFLLSSPLSGDVENLLDVTGEDLCLFFLFHRYTTASQEIFHLLQKRGVPLIWITNPPLSLPQGEMTLTLSCRVDAGGIKNTAAAPIVLCDYLCNAAAATGSQAALEHMKKCEEIFCETNSVEDQREWKSNKP
jgi:DNA-binding MurR/RpiR family transcriptional regulator